MAKKAKNKSKPADGFVMLPRWFWESDYIGSSERSLCITLAYHRNKDTKLCCPSRDTIYQEAGLSQRTYYRTRDTLRKLKLISFENSPGGRKESVNFKLNWLDGSNQEKTQLEETLHTQKPYSKRSGLAQNRSQKTTANRSQNAQANRSQNAQRTIKNYNNKEYQQQQGKKAKPSDDVSLFNILKPKTIQTLKKDPFRVGKKEIIRLLAMTEEKDPDTFFFDWIEHILSDPSIKKPGGYFIKAIERGSPAPPPLYLISRVELFNDFTGNDFRAEKSTKFENMIEREVLEKAKERIKEIPFIYNLKSQIERAKDPERKVRYQEREEQERQKAKIKLVHHICSLIKPSLLTRFRKKLLKVDPGNPNFKQAVARGYELHIKQPYSDSLDEKVV